MAKADGGNKDKTAETTFVIVVKGETTGGDTDITIEDLNDKISDLESTIKDLQNLAGREYEQRLRFVRDRRRGACRRGRSLRRDDLYGSIQKKEKLKFNV